MAHIWDDLGRRSTAQCRLTCASTLMRYTWDMKNYLEKRREEQAKRDGGFTLMEMLIVVAIIAVLIAIAIPVFTTQLERSRDTTTVANLRSAYAEASAAYLTGSLSPVTQEVEDEEGNKNIVETGDDYIIVKVRSQGTMEGFVGVDTTVLAFTVDDSVIDVLGQEPGEHEVTFTWSANGECVATV